MKKESNLPYNLQFFTEGNSDPNLDGSKAGSGDDPKNTDSSQMVNMTQEEFDKKIATITAKQAKKAEKAFMESDDYKAFVDWQEKQKTDDEKKKEDAKAISSLEKRVLDAEQKAQMYENMETVRTKGVKEKLVKMVTRDIMSQVDEDNDFEAILEKYDFEGLLEDGNSSNPTFKGGKRHNKTNNDDVTDLRGALHQKYAK